MREGECIGHAGDKFRSLVEGETTPGQAICQGRPADQLADQVASRPAPSRRMDLDDVRVVEVGGAARLAEEPINRLGTGDLLGPKYLESDLALCLRIPGTVDDPEGPTAHYLLQ